MSLECHPASKARVVFLMTAQNQTASVDIADVEVLEEKPRAPAPTTAPTNSPAATAPPREPTPSCKIASDSSAVRKLLRGTTRPNCRLMFDVTISGDASLQCLGINLCGGRGGGTMH